MTGRWTCKQNDETTKKKYKRRDKNANRRVMRGCDETQKHAASAIERQCGAQKNED